VLESEFLGASSAACTDSTTKRAAAGIGFRYKKMGRRNEIEVYDLATGARS
jgi:hypothetical protein